MTTAAPRSVVDAEQLLALSDIISKNARIVINEWAKNPIDIPDTKDGVSLPSHELYQARREILAAAGMLTEVIDEPQHRLLEVSSQYFESRALHIAAEHRIPDILKSHDKEGVSVQDLSAKIGIESKKLSRVMRCLCSNHLFREVKEDCFANNKITGALVGNEPLRAYLMLFSLDLYSASDYFPKYLVDPVNGHSYDVHNTAWQPAVGTKKSRWEWLEEKIPADAADFGRQGYPRNVVAVGETKVERPVPTSTETKPRPELEIFGLAMLGGGKVTGTAHIHDYPWESLGNGTIVDVGGGVGGFSLQLSKRFPNLKFIVQDRPAVIEQTKQIWAKENPEALESRVTLQGHDFFKVNPVKGADIYWFRYIIHDWSDEYCVQIFNCIRESMVPKSRLLICDQVMNTTIGCPELDPAPYPLPANYGYHARYSHQRDLCMAAIINGIERTPAQFKDIIEKAGLVVTRIVECRSAIGLVEAGLPNYE
ncbi:unnamed protein product [Tuber aestivum]|uniref:Uncharacterized protein n=1 Tax=Tuber aestivum TaxID=59557 RepID=A0A292PV75_9PEZI|nr:unnamed protein product [Tuber aestivum]